MVKTSVAKEIAELAASAHRRWPIDGVHMPYSDYVKNNTKIKGKPFETSQYPFQDGIMDCDVEDVSIIKISQVGVTECEVRRTLAFLRRNSHASAIYTLPTGDLQQEVSQTRIKPLVEDSKGIFFTPSGIQRKGLYQVGSSFLHVFNTTEGSATSTPADMLVHDEYDLSNMEMINLFRSRIQNSDFKNIRRLSTPTYIDFGIDAEYKRSNQEEFFVKCPSCNHQQVPLYDWNFIHAPGLPANLPPILQITTSIANEIAETMFTAEFCCEKCRKPLTGALGDSSLREWVATYPTRRAVGKRIRPSSGAKISVPYIFSSHKAAVESNKPTVMRRFINTALGQAHSDGSTEIPKMTIKQALEDPTPPVPSPLRNYCFGADMGSLCHIVIGDCTDPGSPKPVYYMTCPHDIFAATVAQLYAKYNIICGAVDRYPYTPLANQVREQTNGSITPVHFNQGSEVKYLQDQGYAQVDRTSALDEVKNYFDSGGKLNGYTGYGDVLVDHYNDGVRVELPEKPATWAKKTGKDHFCFAHAYMNLSLKILKALDDLAYKGDQRYGNVSFGFVQVQSEKKTDNTQVLGGTMRGGNLF